MEEVKKNIKTLRGIVESDKMNKTRVVVVERRLLHQKFKKYYIKRTKCYTHDENNISREGDYVEIAPTRPLSKLKRWRLIRIIRTAKERMQNNENSGKEVIKSDDTNKNIISSGG